MYNYIQGMLIANLYKEHRVKLSEVFFLILEQEQRCGYFKRFESCNKLHAAISHIIKATNSIPCNSEMLW